MPNVPLPEWATPGAKVAIVRWHRSYGTADVGFTTITRTTKTSVFAGSKGGERRFVTGSQYSYKPEQLREYGRSYFNAELYQADAPEVVRAVNANVRNALKGTTKQAVERAVNYLDDREKVQAAIKALQEWEKTL